MYALPVLLRIRVQVEGGLAGEKALWQPRVAVRRLVVRFRENHVVRAEILRLRVLLRSRLVDVTPRAELRKRVALREKLLLILLGIL